MMDPRHPSGTLFLFAKSDFRSCEYDCLGNAAGRGAPRPPQLRVWGGRRRRHQPKHYHKAYRMSLRQRSHLYAGTAPRSRQCRVALLYLWNSKKPKTAKSALVWSASTLVALSVQGARALHPLVLRAQPRHIDIWLRCQPEDHTQALGCC